jgi:hypothetical protein
MKNILRFSSLGPTANRYALYDRVIGATSGPIVDQSPTLVEFLSAVQVGGVSETENTTSLLLTFDIDPDGVAVENIIVIGATKGVLSGSGVTRSLTISDITVENGETVEVFVGNYNNHILSGSPQTAVVYVKYFTPAQITTSLWLDADDSDTITKDVNNRVSQWDDKSGNNNHLIQAVAGSQPLYNGNQVEFTVNRNIFKNNVANMLNSSGTTSIFIIHDIINPTTASGNFTTILRNSSTEADPTKRRPFIIYGKVGDTLGISNSTSTTPNITSTSSKTGRSVISYTQSSTQATVFLDGAQQSQINNTPDTSTTSELFTLINAADTNNTMVFTEVILVNDLVTLEVRQKVEGYLAWKWALTSKLPNDHPYKNARPRG